MTLPVPPGLRNRETRALVTGGGQGLGLAIAEALAAEGAEALVLAGRDPAKGARAVARLRMLGAEALFVAADVARVADCLALVERARAWLGTLNGLVNAAAATGRGSLLDTTPEVWAEHMDTNARGPFFLMQGFVKQALAAGHGGSVVNILSMVTHCGQPFLAPYSASKAALALLTKNAANAHRSDRIRINGINVGWMDTPAEDATQRRWHGAGDDWLDKAEAKQPFGQLIKPHEVAGLVAYLLSPASGVMTGAIIDHDQNVAGSFPA
jgi:NAD(P)-dependent dehydrogenase (short-subunit alcohol dehydrogenase family)